MTQEKTDLITRLIKEDKITFAEALVLSEKEPLIIADIPRPSFPPLPPYDRYSVTCHSSVKNHDGTLVVDYATGKTHTK